MDKVLGKFDVTQFDPLGETFDPNIHEAIFVIPDAEKDPDTVGNVMQQTGWKMKIGDGRRGALEHSFGMRGR